MIEAHLHRHVRFTHAVLTQVLGLCSMDELEEVYDCLFGDHPLHPAPLAFPIRAYARLFYVMSDSALEDQSTGSALVCRRKPAESSDQVLGHRE